MPYLLAIYDNIWQCSVTIYGGITFAKCKHRAIQNGMYIAKKQSICQIGHVFVRSKNRAEV